MPCFIAWHHPPTHQTIHPSMGGEVSTDFKSSNRIEISQLVQVLLNFEWFRGSPLGVGGGWMGVGVVRGCPPHTCTHMCMRACAHTCARVWHHREFPGIPQKSNGSSHLHEIIMFTTHACACLCMCACTCMCTCVGGTPNHPPSPEPQGAQNTKIQ